MLRKTMQQQQLYRKIAMRSYMLPMHEAPNIYLYLAGPGYGFEHCIFPNPFVRYPGVLLPVLVSSHTHGKNEVAKWPSMRICRNRLPSDVNTSCTRTPPADPVGTL